MLFITHIFGYLIMVGSLSWPSHRRCSLLWTGGRSLSAIAGNPHWKMSECTERGKRDEIYWKRGAHRTNVRGTGLLLFPPSLFALTPARCAWPCANLPCTSPFYSGYAGYFCEGLEGLLKLWTYSRSVRNGLFHGRFPRRIVFKLLQTALQKCSNPLP